MLGSILSSAKTFQLSLILAKDEIGKRLASSLATAMQAGSSSHKIVSTRAGTVEYRGSEAEITRLPSGLIVASLDNNKDYSHIALTYNAGTRFENADTLGITQRIRSAIGLGNDKIPQADIGAIQAMLGCKLATNYNRENIWVSTACVRDYVQEAVQFLGEVSSPNIMGYALIDRTHATDEEIKYSIGGNPGYKLLDMLHSAAYGPSGLGNPLVQSAGVAQSKQLGAIENYGSEHFVSGRAGLIGYGVDHDTLLSYAANFLQLPDSSGPPVVKSAYKGGEQRAQSSGPFTYVAIAAEGASLQDTTSRASQLLLSRLLHSPADASLAGFSLLGDALAASGLQHVQVGIINTSYSDSGLFGIQFSCLPDDVEKVAKTCILAFRGLSSKGVSPDQFEAIKKQEQIGVMLSDQLDHSLMESLADRIVSTGMAEATADLSSEISKISLKDVQTAAESFFRKKLSMAALGNLSSTPFLSELAVA
jgi:ubiquinol-cytochrome c reductase core subunit 2